MVLPGPETFERAGLRAWPGIEVEWDGQWVRRAAGGYTQRANSIQSLDPSDDADIVRRVGEGRAWLERRGLRPIFRVTPLTSPRIVAELDAQGWVSVDRSHLFAMPLPAAIDPDPAGQIYEVLHPAFIAAQQQLQGYSDDRRERMKSLLQVLDVPCCGIVLHDADGRAVASSIMSVADGIAVTGNVITLATERRKGHGSAMMRTGLAWGHSRGALIAALNVAADNPAGQALYRSLGYQRQYDYTYRVPADS